MVASLVGRKKRWAIERDPPMAKSRGENPHRPSSLRLRQTFVIGRDQVGWRDTQRLRQFPQSDHRRIAPTPLKVAEVILAKARKGRELLLRQASIESEPLHVSTYQAPHIHGATLGVHPSASLSTIVYIQPRGCGDALRNSPMATCPGHIDGRSAQHAGPVFRCTNCGATGCREARCSNHVFRSSGQCSRCGKYGTYKSL